MKPDMSNEALDRATILALAYSELYRADLHSPATALARKSALTALAPWVDRFARGMDATDDEFQEAHLAVATRLHTFSANPNGPTVIARWLRSIVRQAITRHRGTTASPLAGQADSIRRANLRRKQSGKPTIRYPIAVPDTELEHVALEESLRDRVDILNDALLTLPESHSAIIQRLALDGERRSVVAQELRLTASELRTLELEAVELLRRAILSMEIQDSD